MPKSTQSFFQFNNIFSIVTSIVMITASFGVLMTRVAVLENKVDTIISQQNEILQNQKDNNNSVVALSLRVTAIEVANNLRK